MDKNESAPAMTDAEKIEKLDAENNALRAGLNDLLVAVRGGGDLGPASEIAQAILDGSLAGEEPGDDEEGDPAPEEAAA